MNIYIETNYRKIIRQLSEERKKIDDTFSFQFLAAQMRIQKAYLSNCLNGKANLSFDQLYLFCEIFELDDNQSYYLFCLLDYEKSGIESRKTKLWQQIKTIQASNLQTDRYLSTKTTVNTKEDLAEYYFDPLNQIVHVCLAIPRFAKDPHILANELGVNAIRILKSLETLEKLRIIRKEKKQYIVIVENVHLPAKHPVFKIWRNQTRLTALQHLNDLDTQSSYSFSVTFSANEKTRQTIQLRFLELLKEIQALAVAAPAEKPYFMGFDLLPWLKHGDRHE